MALSFIVLAMLALVLVVVLGFGFYILAKFLDKKDRDKR